MRGQECFPNFRWLCIYSSYEILCLFRYAFQNNSPIKFYKLLTFKYLWFSASLLPYSCGELQPTYFLGQITLSRQFQSKILCYCSPQLLFCGDKRGLVQAKYLTWGENFEHILKLRPNWDDVSLIISQARFTPESTNKLCSYKVFLPHYSWSIVFRLSHFN